MSQTLGMLRLASWLIARIPKNYSQVKKITLKFSFLLNCKYCTLLTSMYFLPDFSRENY